MTSSSEAEGWQWAGRAQATLQPPAVSPTPPPSLLFPGWGPLAAWGWGSGSLSRPFPCTGALHSRLRLKLLRTFDSGLI